MSERERIEYLMNCYDLTSSQFADRTGIQRASVSHILSGRNKPSLEVMLKIYEAFPHIDMKWLMTGSGEAPSAAASRQPVANTLFATEETPVAEKLPRTTLMPEAEQEVKNVRSARVKTFEGDAMSVEKIQRRSSPTRKVAIQQSVVQQKKVKEVRVYYTDGTYEVLIPES